MIVLKKKKKLIVHSFRQALLEVFQKDCYHRRLAICVIAPEEFPVGQNVEVAESDTDDHDPK